MSLIFTAILVFSSVNATPADAVANYAQAIAEGNPSALGRAFQPSAIMYCTDGRAANATHQSQWKTQLRTTPPPKPVSTKTEWMDVGTSSALMRLSAVRGEKTYVDYLLLARLNTGWRIIGKVCQVGTMEDASSQAGVNATIDTKLASDRSWSGAMLVASIDPRTLVMTLEDGEFVAASLPEWQARYRDRLQSSPGNIFDVTSRVIDARSQIGVARWSFRSASGEYTDRALLLKTSEGWRIMALFWAKEKP